MLFLLGTVGDPLRLASQRERAGVSQSDMHNLAKNMLMEDEKLHSPKSLTEGIISESALD